MGTADGDPEVQRKADGRALRHRAASGAVQPTAGKSHALGVAAAVHGSVLVCCSKCRICTNNIDNTARLCYNKLANNERER